MERLCCEGLGWERREGVETLLLQNWSQEDCPPPASFAEFGSGVKRSAQTRAPSERFCTKAREIDPGQIFATGCCVWMNLATKASVRAAGESLPQGRIRNVFFGGWATSWKADAQKETFGTPSFWEKHIFSVGERRKGDLLLAWHEGGRLGAGALDPPWHPAGRNKRVQSCNEP